MNAAWQESASLLLARVRHDLPARPVAALQVLAMTGDPDVGVADIAPQVARDAGLSARVLRAANSGHYGLPGRAATVHVAVSVIGFQTLRAMAAGIAAGIAHTTALPDGYVQRYANAAASAQLLARAAGANPAECYGIGLLHNLGDWLLHLYDPSGERCLRTERGSDPELLADAQRERYGCTSGQLASMLLTEWGLPCRFVDPIGHQHDLALATEDTSTIVLQAALAVAALAEDDAHILTEQQQGRIRSCGALPELDVLLAQVQVDASWITDLLRGTSTSAASAPQQPGAARQHKGSGPNGTRRRP